MSSQKANGAVRRENMMQTEAKIIIFGSGISKGNKMAQLLQNHLFGQ